MYITDEQLRTIIVETIEMYARQAGEDLKEGKKIVRKKGAGVSTIVAIHRLEMEAHATAAILYGTANYIRNGGHIRLPEALPASKVMSKKLAKTGKKR